MPSIQLDQLADAEIVSRAHHVSVEVRHVPAVDVEHEHTLVVCRDNRGACIVKLALADERDVVKRVPVRVGDLELEEEVSDDRCQRHRAQDSVVDRRRARGHKLPIAERVRSID